MECEQIDNLEIETPWSVFIDFKIQCKSIRTNSAALLHIIGKMFAAKEKIGSGWETRVVEHFT